MKAVYTIDDLLSRETLDAGFGLPARLAVLGWPVAHSASPPMHQAALDECGFPMRYIRLAVEPGQVAEAFNRMRALGFVGCNVTVPHKLDAMAACDVVQSEAKVLGAVNTVRFEANQTVGMNTDGPGFAQAIHEDFGVHLADRQVMIVGAGGGAGQAIAAQCVLLGVKRLVLVNRTISKLSDLLARLTAQNAHTELVSLSFDSADFIEQCRSCDLIVNTSSVGLKETDEPLLGGASLKHAPLVYDTIYKPEVTSLLRLANQQGAKTANGRSMLLHQGALAFQSWFPGTQPLAAMRVGAAV